MKNFVNMLIQDTFLNVSFEEDFLSKEQANILFNKLDKDANWSRYRNRKTQRTKATYGGNCYV